MAEYESPTGARRVVSEATKQSMKASENARHGVNNFLDTNIQGSAARAADRGTTGHHKAPIDVAAETGHSGTGPAMGTGTAGFSTHSRPGHGTAGAGTSTIGGGSGGSLMGGQGGQSAHSGQKSSAMNDFSRDAKRVGSDLASKVGSLGKK